MRVAPRTGCAEWFGKIWYGRSGEIYVALEAKYAVLIVNPRQARRKIGS